jgi:formate dehydrogenase maturation protein FdhE
MDEPQKQGLSEKTAVDKIRINYKNVSSADIMRQIKEEIGKENSPESRTASTAVKEKRNEMKSFVRTVLVQFMRPFRPLIKVLIHDSYQDLVKGIEERLQRLEQEKSDEREKEYIKLLYGLSHNIVVELTKLKIEVDDLRVKVSILEKEFENFKKRERALEKHVFK